MSHTTQPLPARSAPWARRALMALAALLGLSVLLMSLFLAARYLWLPSYVEHKAKEKLARLSEELGQPVSCGAVEMDGLRAVVVRDIVVGRAGHLVELEPTAVLSVPRVRVEVDLVGALRGKPQLDAVEVEAPSVYVVRDALGRSDLDPLLKALDERLAPNHEPDEGKGGGLSGRVLPSVSLRGGRVLVRDELELPLPKAPEPGLGPLRRAALEARSPLSEVYDLSVTFTPAGGGLGPGAALRATGRLRGAEGQEEGPVGLPSSVALDVERVRPPEGEDRDDYWDLKGKFEPELVLREVPGFEFLAARLTGVSLQTPDRAGVEGLSVRMVGAQAPLLEAEGAQVRFVERRPAEVRLEGPRVVLEGDEESGGTLGTLLALVRQPAAKAIAAKAPELAARIAAKRERRPFMASPQAQGDAGERLKRLLRVVPSQVEATGATLTLKRPGREDWRWEGLEAKLEHKLLQGSVEGRVSFQGNQGGQNQVSGSVAYQTGESHLKAALDGFDLGALIKQARPDLKAFRGAVLTGSVEVERASWESEVRVEGDMAIHDLALHHPKIAPEPLEDIDLRARGVIRWDEARGDLHLEDGKITLEEVATASLEVDLWGIGQGAPTSPVDLKLLELRFGLPPTPAQELFEAVPHGLRAELDGTKLGGRFGLTFQAKVDPLRITDMQTQSKVFAEGLEVVSLNERTDVRKLMGEFTHRVTQPETGYEFETSPSSGSWTSLDRVSPYVVKAVRTNEDGSFYSHGGISWLQVKSTIERNVKERNFTRGASTVSMQVVKNVLLSQEKTVARKLQEVFLTLLMENVVHVPKDKIMEVYLNIVEWGPYVYGIQSASRHYFGKSPSQLSVGEAVFLISILPGPRKYHSYYARGGISPGWWERMKDLIEVMLSRGHITQEEYDEAIVGPPGFSYGEGGPPARRGDLAAPAPTPDEERAADGPSPEEDPPPKQDPPAKKDAPLRFDQDAKPVPPKP